MNIREEGAVFLVICTRCNAKFKVIRNWGGGVCRYDDQNINPALCTCGSRRLEVF